MLMMPCSTLISQSTEIELLLVYLSFSCFSVGHLPVAQWIGNDGMSTLAMYNGITSRIIWKANSSGCLRYFTSKLQGNERDYRFFDFM